MKIHGVEGMSAENIRDEVNRGGRLVIYTYCVSIAVLTFKRPAGVRLVRVGQNPLVAGLPYTLLSLVTGWWGIPWGPIYTIEVIHRNLSGGIDVTDDVLRHLLPAGSDRAATPAAALPAAPRRSHAKGIALTAGFLGGAVLLGLSAFCLYEMQHLPVVLVSGLDRPYEVTLNGTTHKLAPYGTTVLELPEGDFTLADAGGSRIVGAPQTFAFGLSYFSHLTEKHVAILNPDRAAVLLVEDVPYYADGTTPPAREEPAFSVLVNQPSYFIPRPDYLVEEAESRVSLPSGTTRLVKTRLEAVRPQNLARLLEIITQKLGYPAAREHLQILAPRYADENFLAAAADTLKPGDLRTFYRRRLAERPVLVEWHRYYQQATERTVPGADLVGEYRGYLQADQGNGALLYLLGRVTTDRAEAGRYFHQALAAQPPCAYAEGAIGYDLLCNGEYAGALACFRAGEQAGIASPGRALTRRQALRGLRQFDALLADIRAERKANRFDLGLVAAEIEAVVAAGQDATAAQKIIEAHLAMLKKDGADANTLKESGNFLGSVAAEVTGEFAKYADLAGQLDLPFYDFRARLSAGDLAAATAAALHLPNPDATDFFLLYLLARRLDDPAAEKLFARAEELMKNGATEMRLAAELLSKPDPAAAEICHLAIDPDNKCVLLTALGEHDPGHRSLYHAMAAKLDISLRFPHRLLGMILDPPAAPGH